MVPCIWATRPSHSTLPWFGSGCGIVARPLRIEFAGPFSHLTGGGNARQRIFADEPDCAEFVQLLLESLERYDVALHAYVLMGNHYGLMAEARRANLSRWMIVG